MADDAMCANCRFFYKDETAVPTKGQCRESSPQMVVLTQPHPINIGQIVQTAQGFWPTLEGALVCGKHQFRPDTYETISKDADKDMFTP